MTSIQQLLTDNIAIWTSADNVKKSGRGRSSSNGDNVYGIKKLRELILELAVRGKLVPQDPNDEPASELLKQIQLEKNRLVSKGTIKKSKPLTPISENEKVFELPQGWEWTKLGFLSEIKGGKRLPAGTMFSNSATPYVYIRVTNMKDGTIVDENLKYIDEKTYALINQYTISSNDLYITIAGTIGDVGSVPKRFCGMNLTENAAKIVFRLLNKEWLKLTLRSSLALKQFLGKTNILAQPKLALHRIADTVFAIPPLAEQKRIEAKVQELMALCDQMETQHINVAEAHEKLVTHLLGTLTQSKNSEEFSENWQRIATHFDTLFTTEASIDALKQTILQLGVMGKLVSQDPNDEPASELLKKIKAEKVKLIAKGKIKKEKSSVQIVDEENLYKLPKGWLWTTLASISQINPRNNAEDNLQVSFVPMTMIGLTFDSVHQQELRLWKEIKQGFMHFADGDIGVAKITPCFENSKACVFSGLLNGIGAGTTELHIIRPLKETIVPRYILAYLKSPQFLLIGETKMTGTAGQKRLPKEFVEMNPFPLPPLVEQRRIVAKIDELMALCDQLKSKIIDVRQLQKKLADVMVEQAIR